MEHLTSALFPGYQLLLLFNPSHSVYAEYGMRLYSQLPCTCIDVATVGPQGGGGGGGGGGGSAHSSQVTNIRRCTFMRWWACRHL